MEIPGKTGHASGDCRRRCRLDSTSPAPAGSNDSRTILPLRPRIEARSRTTDELVANPREGEAPAEPSTLGRARLLPSRPTLGRARLPPSRQPSGGRGSRRAGKPREGEAPAEPPNLGRARLPPSRQPLGRARLLPSRPTLGRARLPPSRQTSGGRGARRAAGGNKRLLLRCLGGFISPRNTRNTRKHDGETVALFACTDGGCP